ncbi:MAG: hypothetical protein ABWX74_14645 [Aeromicrobium sp.]
MVDDEEPVKRVVKRVVKKTVVRPAAPAEPAPKLRYGRPVSTSTKPRATVSSRSGPKTPAPTTKAAPRTRPTRQPVDVRAKLRTVRDRTGSTWRVVAGGVGGGARTGGSFVATRARTVAAYRLPRINLYLAAAITGAVVGLVTVGLGLISLVVFEQVRGVASGGGLWGGLTLIGLTLVAYLLGEALLRGFGSSSGRLTSFLAIVLVIIAILGLFLDLADSWAALALVPALGVVAFAVSHWLIDIAEHTPTSIE